MAKPYQLWRKPLRAPLALAAALAVALGAAPAALAQREAPASVAGRVRDGERGVPGITVVLFFNETAQRFRAATRVKTDAEGRFLFSGVAPGRYQIMPVAPTYVVAGLGNNYPPGRPLTLLAGEEIRDLDFTVEPGGVITGRVTDADGNPVVGEPVWAAPADDDPPRPRFNVDQRDQATDDRGVYRLYGLPPGRYRVSVGRADEAGAVSFSRRKLFRRTFYPDAAEPAQARVVEVRAGQEAEDVDITVGRPLKTYRAAGRFVSAETGQPVPNASFGYGTLDPRTKRIGAYGGGQMTNAAGEFRTEALAPGRYAIFSMPPPTAEGTEFYSEPLAFEVTDADVTGLTVRLKRGATVSGVVALEGVSDRAAAARMLSVVRVFGWVEERNQMLPMGNSRPASVGPDGSFRMSGLSAGKLRIGATADAAKGLTVSRVELGGTNIMGGLDVADGAQLTGVRIVMVHGTGSIVGQTVFDNGAMPPGARIMATARNLNSSPGNNLARSTEVDARGYFRLEGLPAGEYEVVVNVFGGGRASRSEPQRVVLGDGGEAKVAPVVDFADQPPRRRPPGGQGP